MTYGDFKDLTRRTTPDKILRDKVFNIAKNLKYDGHQHGLASMVNNFFDKKASRSAIKNQNMSDQQLAEELHKAIIRTFNKRKVQSLFIDTARKTIFSFSKCSKKLIFPKKSHWNMIFLVS